MSPYHQKAKDQIRDRVKYWLQKDPSLTNRQICEITGASDHLVSQLRRDLKIPNVGLGTLTQKDVRQAYYKFLDKRGLVDANFNPHYNVIKEKGSDIEIK